MRRTCARPLLPEENTLKADPFSQLRLLDVQELDTRLDLLRHRLAHLPETKELDILSAERTEVGGQSRDAQIVVNDLTRDQSKADADVEQVKARRVRDQDRMDRGLVTNPKDLERMQQELISLNRRIAELEDTELEVMEQLESAQAEQARLVDRLATIDTRSTELVRSRDATGGELTRQVEALTAERKVTATGVPADLLTLYEKLRTQKGGVGAAVLRARQCSGCSLQVNASDLGAIAKAPLDEVLRCEECSRILVRTSESGI